MNNDTVKSIGMKASWPFSWPFPQSSFISHSPQQSSSIILFFLPLRYGSISKQTMQSVYSHLEEELTSDFSTQINTLQRFIGDLTGGRRLDAFLPLIAKVYLIISSTAPAFESLSSTHLIPYPFMLCEVCDC
jgi:hypothetical protein